MTTLMGDLQKRIEDAVGSTGTFDESLQKLANLYGIAPSSNPSRIIPVAADFDSSITTAPAALNYLLYNPDKLPTLGLDFINNTTLDSRITFTRALNTATYFNSAGVLTTANANVPRFDYDPSTLAPRGLLIEEARTNSIRNNTMQGAVAGTPGTLPQVSGSASWQFSVATTTGLTSQIVEIGVESGITYIDLKLSGTASGAGSLTIAFEPNTQIVATQNQVWTVSMYRRLMAGSFNGLTPTTTNIFLNSYTAVGVFDANATSTVRNESIPTNAALNTQRSTLTGTLGSATTARVNAGMFFSIANGAAIDITLRIGLPQLEQGAFATSVIPTTTTALTRNADVASVNTLSPWYNATEGTLFGEAAVSYTSGGSNLDAVASVDDNTTNNRIQIRRNAATQIPSGIVMAAGTATFNSGATGATTVGANTVFRIGMAYKANDSIFGDRGLLSTVDTSVTIPTVTQLQIGNGTALQQLNGWVRRITYYPRRLSNAELQAITA